ncbi:MAG: sulfite exporter TauE/SafE family protein [Candidatus Aenigmarchaeota archaeon]|nr:sulfite exporter TauE/SafE family protein [Candidatus Aenigmarchaeota archaeon]
MTRKTETFDIDGMHCNSCETLIRDTLEKSKGIIKVNINYSKNQGKVTFDTEKTTLKKIFNKIDKKGYTCHIKDTDNKESMFNTRLLGIIFGTIGLLIIGMNVIPYIESIPFPEISANMSYGLLFLVGLLTGFHCISMCGGFVISYTAKDAQEGKSSHKSHLMYGLGKTISYTVIGAAFGLLGSIITFTPMMRGMAGIIAGLFLIIFGLNMLNIFPALRKLRIQSPKFLNKFIRKESKEHNNPLTIGLLNGLMIACGPLQAIYIMAAGTGSMIEGAKLLFIFALGTLPVMMSFGLLTNMISKKATHKILKASGAIVIILGLVMVNTGLSLTGTGLDTNTLITSSKLNTDKTTAKEETIQIQDGYQIINMDVTRYGWVPDKFILKKGIPVKWVINGKEVNGCNNAIQVPKLGLNFDIKKGEQTIEFTPDTEGVIPWSCWMGMIPGTFIVTGDDTPTTTAETQQLLDATPTAAAGSCGGSCGSSTCGGSNGGTCGCGS